MTSNIGARQLKDFGQGVGFSTSTKKDAAEEYSKGVIENALKKTFAPEFLNRIDDAIIFNHLNKENIHEIIDIELEGLYQRLDDLGYKIKIKADAKNYISDKGYDPDFGARPLSRAIQKYLEDPLAEELIKTKIEEGSTINVSLSKEKEISITVTKPRKKKDQPAK